jgi:glycosyltransferase involved in cell wall biosynthesis
MGSKYIIISPVRNEEKYVKKTLQSVINQTVKPIEWIIVNDGSTDGTRKIIEEYTRKYDWIKGINLKDRGFYYPGKGVVEIFYKGFNEIKTKKWNYLVKLDCDLCFDNDYFEKILNKFMENKKLGIASGCTFLPMQNCYVKEKNQKDHPCGVSKIYKKECFESIGGLKPIPGWDLADILSAQMKGWETKCFMDYKITHYKQTGSQRKGITRGAFFTGQVHCRLGYLFIYALLRAIYRITERPYLIGGLGYISGYVYSMQKKQKKYFDAEMIEFLRKKQRRYLIDNVNVFRFIR